ncbi:hypothetical protein Y032_0286g1416 [Ancylostoma ceylanicum]|uniref:7TM GPCR serpentine receptor class x (Srx) domain-containing protein n=1 Tax=Ancylostoma ceylanicum TaxID=53326 RepID=A0A016S618_9BILA|nr:hypothetical protein Y032_0286g1416 [Ancylostoma ceylanicum]
MLLAHLFGVKTLYPDPTMYECTGTKDEFYPNLGIGLLYLLLGVIFQITYIPCVIVMNQPPLRSMPCFKVMYDNVPHAINNGIVIVSLIAFYPVICGSLAYRIWKKKSNKISAMTRQIILQSMVICGCHITGCFLYAYMQFFPVPTAFAVIGNLAWIGNHGNFSHLRNLGYTLFI